MKVWCYKNASDVALCEAETIAQAIEKFRRMYNDVNGDNVTEVKYNSYGVFVATGY